MKYKIDNGWKMKNNLEIEGLDYKSIDPSLKKIRRIIMSIFMLILLIANTTLIVSLQMYTELTTTAILLYSLYVVIIVMFIWFWWLIGRQVDNYKYAKAEKDLVISKGVLFREIKAIPYGRMQFVDVHQGPLLRAYKLAKVSLHTASSQSLLPITGIKENEAKILRQELLELGEANLAGL